MLSEPQLPQQQTAMKLASALYLLFALMLLLSSVGCQQRTASKLQGRWEGRPDSAVVRAQREAEKYGEAPADAAAGGSATKTDAPSRVTDWENYEVTVLFDFVSSERLEMSLDGEQPRSGRWKIVSTSPAECTIEVLTEKEGAEGEDAITQRRQFVLLLDEREGECVGFLLTEVGADRQQGALYFRRPGFQRPESSGVVRSN